MENLANKNLILDGATIALNETEAKVLLALYNQTIECTGGEFGYAMDARKETGLAMPNFKGYLSSFLSKNVFEYIDQDYSTTYGGQFALKPEVMAFFES